MPKDKSVVNAVNGVVLFIIKDHRLGFIVVIEHANGALSTFAYMKAISVTPGEKVFDGTIIGYVK